MSAAPNDALRTRLAEVQMDRDTEWDLRIAADARVVTLREAAQTALMALSHGSVGAAREVLTEALAKTEQK